MLTGVSAFAKDHSSQNHGADHAAADDGEAKAAGLLSLLPPNAVTEHVLKTETGELAYTATAGTLALRGGDGAVTAKIFYTAYRAKQQTANRPITFVFNGGPGAASAYLHLGLVGPKILPFTGQNKDGTQPQLQDNPESWLAFTDLVLIDPVGTGWSRAAKDDDNADFWKVREDAEALAKVIALYVQDNDLGARPKYLLGESYGGFRTAKVARSLKDRQGILVSGLIMLSPLLDGRFVFADSEDPLAAALQFPSLAAAAMERRHDFDLTALHAAETFAMHDFLTILAGPTPTGKAADDFFGKIAAMTGVPEDSVRRTRGFVGKVYWKEAAGEGHVVSPYDSGVSDVDAYPEDSYLRNDDAILDGYTRAYGGAFADYARNVLNFKTGMTYNLLNETVARQWKWNGSHGGESRVTATIAPDLRDLLSTIPSLKIMIAQGYSDTLCPYSAARYLIDHLPPALAENRVQLKLYHGGHMFYTDEASRKAVFADAEHFYP
ncbi:S10 family peptidase [Allorhizobium sonneratiae]|uniref:S10 family peptidase n=1 Tax=Allorhizobium sonneratiae TaxID=2934936 RepID=UPI0020345CE2|nr:alpha/beta fold hydrolase [Allorhizobium sonneratiae]